MTDIFLEVGVEDSAIVLEYELLGILFQSWEGGRALPHRPTNIKIRICP